MEKLKEKIEKQLTFAQTRQTDSKYHEHLRWDGYIQALRFVLANIESYETKEMQQSKDESEQSKVGVV